MNNTTKNNFDIFLSQLNQISQVISKCIHASFEERTATILQLLALKFLASKPSAAINELALELQLSMSSATQLIERLTKCRFIIRTTDQNDRRITRLTLTEEGLAELMRLQDCINSMLEKAFEQMPDDDLKELMRIHNLLLEKLQTALS